MHVVRQNPRIWARFIWKGKKAKDREWEINGDEFEREEGMGGRGRNRKVKRVESMSVGGSAFTLRSSHDGQTEVSRAA